MQAKEAVVVQARVVEGLMQEDRQHDKAARRDLAEVPEHTAALLALYRKRVYQQAPQVHMQRHLSRRMSRRGSMGAHALGRKPSSRGGGLSHAHGSVASRPSLYGEDSEGSVSGATSGQPFEALVGAFGSLQDAAPGMGDLDPHPGKGAEEVVMEHVAPLAAEEMPAGLDLGWWERLQGLRDAKIDVERRLRRQQKV